MAEQIEELKKTFHEIFQTEQAELDFGIYRIMREKRVEVDNYIEHQLLIDLRQSFQKWQTQTVETLQKELNEDINAAIRLGFDPDTSKEVKKKREILEATKYTESLVESVLSDLVQFLGRYYKEGDFLSLPRYRRNSYAIEYHGEEVKLHWANADQYYVKTAERFRDYRFLLPDGKAVHFKIKAANTETGNNKAENGKERRFQLIDGEFIGEETGELLIFFRYEQDEQKRRQDVINAETAERILQADGLLEWRKALGELLPTEKNPNRTLLDKHLAEYTARNTFDYFIHKDLEGFLRRELDFYIKNEIVRLDDIENEDAPRVELYLAKVKALRRTGHKLIAFLAQVENFQKKLFLKKKFVIRADYCVTLDRVPRDLWADVLANTAQIEEWRRLYAIDEIEADLFNGAANEMSEPPASADSLTAMSEPPALAGGLSVQFLAANQNLIVDTKHFPAEWKIKLLASFDDLDAATDGVLIKSDNFHALTLLQEKYREAVKCIYIDPPYNTDASPIAYKNGYRSSSWLSLIENRLFLARNFLANDGVFCITIDDYQIHELAFVLDSVFDKSNSLGTSVIRINPSGRSTVSGFSVCHEYAFFYGASNKSILAELPRTEKQLGRFSQENGQFVDWRNFRKDGGAVTHRAERPKQFYPIYVRLKDKTIRIPKLEWNSLQRVWNVLEAPSDNEVIIYPIDEKGKERVWSYNHITALQNLSNLEVRVSKDNSPQIFRRHIPSEGVLPRSWMDKNTYAAREYGSAALTKLFGETAVFDFAKSPFATQDCIWISGLNETDEYVLDFFAGSATTAHAVINLNREDGGNRKYILVETNEYFDTVTLPRIKKVVYAKEWRDGKPVKREGSPHVLKYFALESYEDAMNNLALRRTKEQEQGLLEFTREFYEDYLLNYMLEFEAAGSQSLLNLDNFAAPFDYRMKIAVNGVGETQETAVDLVETFNYLIGLHVSKIEQINGFRVVRGTTRRGERCLILWRTIKDLNQELTDKRLNDFLEKANFDFSDVDTLYTNGDAAIPIGSVRKETDAWQIKMIEAEFLRQMFSSDKVSND